MLRVGHRVTVAAAFLALAAASFGCTPNGAAGGQPGGGLELVKNKCTVCHTADRITQAKKDRAAWEKTVTRMRANGAVLTDAEAAQVIDYLTQSGAK